MAKAVYGDALEAPRTDAEARRCGYRLLMAGDTIQSGDEALQADAVTWVKVRGWSFGMAYTPGPTLLPHRRPLHPNPKSTNTGEQT